MIRAGAALAALLLTAPFHLHAEIVEIVVEQDVPEGTRLHVGSEIHEMGGGDPLLSVPMIERTPDEWFIRFDLPPGREFTPRLYLRPESWSDYDDPAEIEELPPLDTISTDILTEQTLAMTLHMPAEVRDVTLLPEGPGLEGTESKASQFSEQDQWRIFSLEIPIQSERVAIIYRDIESPRELALFYENPIRVAAEELWLRGQELFLYEPPAEISAPRFESFTFVPGNFLARDVTIMLPRGYDQNSTKTYPVLYAMDGQNVFTPGGPFGTWAMDTTTQSLIRRGEIPEIIVVAVNNSPERIPEYAPEFVSRNGANGRSGEFLTMLRDELKPYIDDTYRTRTAPEFTGFIGSSMGGLIGYYAAHEFRDTFGIVAALSPSFWLSLEDFEEYAARSPEDRARVWLDSGHGGRSGDGAENTLLIRNEMLLSGEALGPHFTHTIGLGHEHNERAWAERLPDILRWLFPPELVTREGN